MFWDRVDGVHLLCCGARTSGRTHAIEQTPLYASTMWVPYSLAARLLVREVSLERCVLVPHAPELAFFAVRGRRRGGPRAMRDEYAALKRDLADKKSRR